MVSVTDLVWKPEDDCDVITAAAALADRLSLLRVPCLVVLGSPIFQPSPVGAKRCARRLAEVVSQRGVMTIYPEALWSELFEAGCRCNADGKLVTTAPIATKEVVIVWRRWMPTLTSLAVAAFVDKPTKLAMDGTPLRVEKAGRVSMARLDAAWAPPELDASNCLALLCPRAVKSLGDCGTLFGFLGHRQSLLDHCTKRCASEWAKPQPEMIRIC